MIPIWVGKGRRSTEDRAAVPPHCASGPRPAGKAHPPRGVCAGASMRLQQRRWASESAGEAWGHASCRRPTRSGDSSGTFGCEGGWSPEWRQPMNSQQPSGMNTSATESARSHQSGSEQGVRAKAGEAVSKLADVAQQAGSQAKQAASSLASDANQRAKGFLNQQVATGADLVGHVADSVRSAADNLDHSAPQLAGVVRGAAERGEEFSKDMREQSVEELVRTASDFPRRQPALVFGLPSLAGFVLLRVLKSNPPSNSRDSQPAGARFEGSRQFHGV